MDVAPSRWDLGLGPHINDSKSERWTLKEPSPIEHHDDATIADEISFLADVDGPQLGTLPNNIISRYTLSILNYSLIDFL